MGFSNDDVCNYVFCLQKPTCKHCMLFRQSHFGVARLEVYETRENARKNVTSKIITLENCVKISTAPPTSFTIVTKEAQYDFNTLSLDELQVWVSALQSVVFRDDVSKVTMVEEDNDLYCSLPEDKFVVQLAPSDVARRCNLEQNKYYTLILKANAIQLCEDQKILFTWPYRYIRRYGYRSGTFTFVAGRMCKSGEGEIHIKYQDHKQIFNSLIKKMNSMKKILSGESTLSLLDVGDNQFQAALGMEARSRSPLPPSPTSWTRIHDVEIDSAQNSIKSNSTEERAPLPKPRPSKPPRKILNSTSSLNHIADDIYEPLDYDINVNYDDVEQKSEAWRTLGIDDDCDIYCSWQKDDEFQPVNNTTLKPKPPNGMYDKLQFFGSTSKLATPGYKQVTPVASNSYPAWNEYAEVQVGMDGIRLADDSHLGYALIRKTTKPDYVEETSSVPHQVFNDNVYAVVSKPKQV